jgi:hypothetical protein
MDILLQEKIPEFTELSTCRELWMMSNLPIDLDQNVFCIDKPDHKFINLVKFVKANRL